MECALGRTGGEVELSDYATQSQVRDRAEATRREAEGDLERTRV